MWSKLGSAHAKHWWTQGSKKATGGERGALEAALCSSGLGQSPAKPCYPEEAVLGAETCRAVNSLSLSNRLDECCAGPGERPANRFIGGGKAGDLSAPQGAYLYRPAGNRSREGGHPQGWKAQTRRAIANEMAWRAGREMDLPPDPGARHLAKQRARRGRLLFGSCHCDSPVDNAEHALFVCAKWGAAREVVLAVRVVRGRNLLVSPLGGAARRFA